MYGDNILYSLIKADEIVNELKEEGEDTSMQTIHVGEKFEFKGYQWVALEVTKDSVTAIMTKAWDTAEFDENSSTDWRTSTIRKRLQNELLPILGEENLITRSVDLVADNGDRRYGRSDDKIWLLSCDDFRKCREIIMANCDFEDDWWWTLTPWYIDDVGIGSYVRFIIPAGYGYVYSSSVCGRLGVAPACVFRLEALERGSRELKVGDEFTILGKAYVVTKTEDTYSLFACIDENGEVHVMHSNIDHIKKTGRHFPQVADLLRQMEE